MAASGKYVTGNLQTSMKSNCPFKPGHRSITGKSVTMLLAVLCFLFACRPHENEEATLPAPSNLQAVDITETGARLCWQGNTVQYVFMLLDKAGDTLLSHIQTDTLVLLTDLLPGCSYNWQVASLHDLNYSQWATSRFNTAGQPFSATAVFNNLQWTGQAANLEAFQGYTQIAIYSSYYREQTPPYILMQISELKDGKYTLPFFASIDGNMDISAFTVKDGNLQTWRIDASAACTVEITALSDHYVSGKATATLFNETEYEEHGNWLDATLEAVFKNVFIPN